MHFDGLPSLEGILPNLLCFTCERAWKVWWIRAQSSCRGISQAGVPGSGVLEQMFSVKRSWLGTAAPAARIHWSRAVPGQCRHVWAMQEPRELIVLWSSFVPGGCECLALIRAGKLYVMNSVQLRLADAISAGKWESPGVHVEPKAHLWKASFAQGLQGAWESLRSHLWS